MGPGHYGKQEREKKLKALISFAQKLPRRLSSSANESACIEELQAHIRSLPLQASSTVTAKRNELDAIGIDLWNLSTRLRRDEPDAALETGNNAIRNKMICLVRVFAFLLLDTAGRQAAKGIETKSCIRLMKIALKTAKTCLEFLELDSATKVLERAADYQEILEKPNDGDKNNVDGVVGRIRAEYFVVRTTLAWRQDRMDTAEHMFAKVKQLRRALDPTTAEQTADLLYEIAKDFSHKGSYELTVRWMERAHDMIGEQDIEMLSADAGQLRLSILQGLIKAHMKLGTPEDIRKAWDLINLLETDYAEKMIVPLLKLELLSISDQFDTNQYSGALMRMIRSVVLTELNFKTFVPSACSSICLQALLTSSSIIHRIHTLKNKSEEAACKCLDDFIDLRLFSAESQDWIEKATVLRVWCTPARPTDPEESICSLHELFSTIMRKMKSRLTENATHSIQTLLWKLVETCYSQEQYKAAESWCDLALHSLLDHAGEFNKATIARKMIMCATARGDEAAARETFSKMSDTGKNEPKTRFLMYKLAIRTKDTDLASECLDFISRQSSKDEKLLCACVLEAQTAGDKRQTLQALEKVLEKCENSAPAGVHIPALIRSTIRLLSSELVEHGNKVNPEIAEELCKAFEGAIQAKASRRRPTTPEKELFTPQEFEWFSKNAYNLSLKHCTELEPQILTRLLDSCIQFINLLNEYDKSEMRAEVPLRLMFCDFLAACAYTTLARGEDNVQISLQHYLAVRRHSRSFRSTASEQLESGALDESTKSDAISKYVQVAKLEIEAALKLEDWDHLDKLFNECWKYGNAHHWDTLADLVLVVHSTLVKGGLDAKYQTKTLGTLQTIINLSWRQGDNDIEKISRWIRCLFQLALTFDESISIKCLDQANKLADGLHGSPSHYPQTELEWLATTAFNHAVDYYVAQDDARCKLWAEKALGLAGLAEDGGGLRKLLVEKYSGLVWE